MGALSRFRTAARPAGHKMPVVRRTRRGFPLVGPSVLFFSRNPHEFPYTTDYCSSTRRDDRNQRYACPSRSLLHLRLSRFNLGWPISRCLCYQHVTRLSLQISSLQHGDRHGRTAPSCVDAKSRLRVGCGIQEAKPNDRFKFPREEHLTLHAGHRGARGEPHGE